jgi:hypothetical protein
VVRSIAAIAEGDAVSVSVVAAASINRLAIRIIKGRTPP